MNLSSSSLSVFSKCPRCFWFEKNHKISRPRGIFPSLPGGMDRVIKAYFDSNRSFAHPEFSHPDLANFQLFPVLNALKCWRQWNSKGALKVVAPHWTLVGGLDDLLISKDGLIYAPLDYKTAGSDKRTEEEAREYYQTQMDIYSLMLAENGMPPAGFGVLLTYSPEIHLSESCVQFKSSVFILTTDPERARELCDRAADCLTHSAPPPFKDDCEYCQFASKRYDPVGV